MKNQNANKNKNKGLKGVLALALAVLMTAASVLPAFATGDTGSKEKTTSIGDVFNALTENTVRAAKEVGSASQSEYIEEDAAFYYEDEAQEVTYDFIEVDELPEEEAAPAETPAEVAEETPEEVVEEVPEEEILEIPDVKLSDKPEDRNKNVLGLAAAYIGWGESLRDYKEYTDGTVVGSTIFGDSQNENYKAWNVSFVSYILQQAGIEDLPVVKNMGELVKELKDEKYAGRIMNADDYEPVEGDLVLLGLPGKKLSEINAPKKQESFDDLDAAAYNTAGAGVAAGLIGASAVASENRKDTRREAIYTRIGIVVSKEKKAVTDDEGKEVKDAAGKVVEHTFLTVIEGDVEDPVVAGNTEIDAQYRMTGTVQEVEYDLDEMTLTYDDIKDLKPEEIDELKKTDPQVLDYIVLYVEEEEEAEEPAPTPAPTPVENISSADIKQDGIGAGVALGLAVKPKTEQTGSEEARAALANTDLSSLRLLIGTEDENIFKGDDRVVAGYNGIYLLQAETLKEAEEAFLTYFDKADFVAPDVAVAIADGETDEDPEEEILNTETVYTEKENPFAELETALEDVPAAPKRNVRRIALIDTGAAPSDNVIEAVSMIGEDGADDNGHGERMVEYILSQDPEAEIISIKALGADGVGDISAVIAGINYAMENKASIINLSLAAYASEENAALADAIRKATEAGITVVGAAGNQGFNAKYYMPANIAEALIVGAADETGNRIAASNFGETVDYNVVAETTSEAAAKLSGFISANGAEAIEGALNAGLIFATDYTGEDRSGEEYEGAVAQDDLVVTSWAKLAKAISDVQAGSAKTIKLGGDLVAATTTNTPNGAIVINNNRQITLISDSAATIYRNESGNDTNFSMFKVEGGATLTIGNHITLTGDLAKKGTKTETTTVTSGDQLEIKNGDQKLYVIGTGLTNLRFAKKPEEDQSYTAGCDEWELEAITGEAGKFYIKNVKTGEYIYGEASTPVPATDGYGGNQYYGGEKVGRRMLKLKDTKPTTGMYKFRVSDGTFYLEGEGGRLESLTTSGTADALFSVYPAAAAAQIGQFTMEISVVSDTVTPSTDKVVYLKNPSEGKTAVKTSKGVNPTKFSPFPDDKGFFVHVTGGTFNLNGGTLRDFEAGQADAAKNSPKNVAPVVVEGGTINLTSGTITGNSVGYGGDDSKSTGAANWVEWYLGSVKKTDSAGAVIIKGANTSGTISGTANIGQNRGDIGAILLTDGASLTMTGGEINQNVGFHHAGAVQVENGAKFNMSAGEIKKNVTWSKGGAVWVTEWGTRMDNTKDWGRRTITWPGKDTGTKKLPGGIFIMSGSAKLEGNYAFLRGGAINVESNHVSLLGGEIKNNWSRVLGGGIYVEGDFPDYSYTLYIKEGYIGNNTALSNNSSNADWPQQQATLQRRLSGRNDAGDPVHDASEQATNPTGDNAAFPGMYQGNGGGVWLCPIGGASVFTIGTVNGVNYNVVIDENTATGGNASRRGTDFFLERGTGHVTVYNIGNNWVTDPGNSPLNFANATILSGAFGMRNTGSVDADDYPSNSGVKIYNNTARDGGGIAANGTLVFGQLRNVYRLESNLKITKSWPGQTIPKAVEFRAYYMDGTEQKPLTAIVSRNDNPVSEEDIVFTMNYSDSDQVGGSNINNIDGLLASTNRRTWHYIMNMPASVTRKDASGNVLLDDSGNPQKVALYKLVDPSTGAEYDPADADDVETIYGLIPEGGEKTFTVTNWNLVIEEQNPQTGGGENVVFHPGNAPSQATLTALEPKYTQIYNGDGTALSESRFSVNFSTTTMEQTFYNDLEPTVEKYVNKNVHDDIDYNEEFTYDVMAYVPMHATDIKITDTLVKVLEFATNNNGAIKDLSLEVLGDFVPNDITAETATLNRNNHNANGQSTDTVQGTVSGGQFKTIALSNSGNTKNYKVDGQTIEVYLNTTNYEKGFRVANDDGSVNADSLLGRWIRLTFKARIKSQYRSSAALKAELVDGVWETVKDQDSYTGDYPNYDENQSGKIKNGGVKSSTYSATNPHTGIANNAKYQVNNKGTYTSNTVTVVPPVTEIVLEKKDASTGRTMNNVSFTLRKANGDLVETKSTGNNGRVTFGDLTTGSYYIEETNRVEGYEAMPEKAYFKVTRGVVAPANYADAGVDSEGYLTIAGLRAYMTDAMDAGSLTTQYDASYIPLKIVDMNNSSAKPDALDETKTYWITGVKNGTTYYLQGINWNNQYNDTNRVTWPRLENTKPDWGDHQWKVTEVNGVKALRHQGRNNYPTPHYLYLDGTTGRLSPDGAGLRGLSENGLIRFSYENGQFMVNAQNTRKTYPITVKKVDMNDLTKPLGGAKFKIIKKGSNPEEIVKAIQSTDATTGEITFTGLDWGVEYTLVEVEPPTGYERILRPEGANFRLNANGKLSIDNYTYAKASENNGIQLITVQNRKKKYSVSLHKTGDDGDLNGVTFTLKKSDGTTIASKVTAGNGALTFSNLEEGDYYLEETTPGGYVPLGQNIPFHLGVAGDVTLTGIANLSVNSQTGQLILNGEPLYATEQGSNKAITTAVTEYPLYLTGDHEGSKHATVKLKSIDELLAEDDIYIQVGTSGWYVRNGGSAPEVYGTGVVNFKWELERLANGAYALRSKQGSKPYLCIDGKDEIKLIADTNMLQNAEQVYFGTSAAKTYTAAAGNAITIQVENKEKRYDLNINKKDYQSPGNPLSGATFELYKVGETSPIANANNTTGTDGKISYSNLRAGDYYLVETGRPSGYERLTGKIYFSIAKDANGTKTLKGYVEDYSVDSETGQLMVGGKKLYAHLPAGASLPAVKDATLSNVTVSTEPSEYPLITKYYSGNSGLQQDAKVTSLVENDVYRFQLGESNCYLWGIGKDRLNGSKAGIAYMNVSNGCWWKYVKNGNVYAIQNQWGVGTGDVNMAYICFNNEGLNLSTAEGDIYRKGEGTVVNMTENGSTIELTVRDKQEIVKVDLKANKVLTSGGNRVDIGEGDFSFLLTAKSTTAAGLTEATMPMPSVNPAAVSASAGTDKIAEAVFKDITFTKPGIYVYTISEHIGPNPNPNMTYDRHKCDVTVEVREEDNTNGRLEVVSILYQGTPVIEEQYPYTGTLGPNETPINDYYVWSQASENNEDWGIGRAQYNQESLVEAEGFVVYCLNISRSVPAPGWYKRVSEEEYETFVTQVGQSGNTLNSELDGSTIEKKLIAILYYGYSEDTSNTGHADFLSKLTGEAKTYMQNHPDMADKITQAAIWKATDGKNDKFTNWYDKKSAGFKAAVEALYGKNYSDLPDALREKNLKLDIFKPTLGSSQQNVISFHAIVEETRPAPTSTPPTYTNDGTQAWSITLNKQNGNDENNPLKGASFTLYTEAQYGNGTNRTGGISIDGSEKAEFRWGNLTGGIYYIVEEQAPAGYAKIDPIKVRVKVNTSGGTGNHTATIEALGTLPNGVTLVSTQPTNNNFSLTAKNYHYNFLFGKVDTDNNAINHVGDLTATFALKQGDTVKYVSVPVGDENLYSFVEANEFGVAKEGATPETTNIEAGDYKLVETSAPATYDVAAAGTDVRVSYDATNHKTVLTFPNGSGVEIGSGAVVDVTSGRVIAKNAVISNRNDDEAKINVQNKSNLVGDIEIKKTVYNSDGSVVEAGGDKQLFKFRFTLTDAKGNPINFSEGGNDPDEMYFPAELTGQNGAINPRITRVKFTGASGNTPATAEVQIMHGEILKIKELPAGWKFTVQEVEDDNFPADYERETTEVKEGVVPMQRSRDDAALQAAQITPADSGDSSDNSDGGNASSSDSSATSSAAKDKAEGGMKAALFEDDSSFYFGAMAQAATRKPRVHTNTGTGSVSLPAEAKGRNVSKITNAEIALSDKYKEDYDGDLEVNHWTYVGFTTTFTANPGRVQTVQAGDYILIEWPAAGEGKAAITPHKNFFPLKETRDGVEVTYANAYVTENGAVVVFTDAVNEHYNISGNVDIWGVLKRYNNNVETPETFKITVNGHYVEFEVKPVSGSGTGLGDGIIKKTVAENSIKDIAIDWTVDINNPAANIYESDALIEDSIAAGHEFAIDENGGDYIQLIVGTMNASGTGLMTVEEYCNSLPTADLREKFRNAMDRFNPKDGGYNGVKELILGRLYYSNNYGEIYDDGKWPSWVHHGEGYVTWSCEDLAGGNIQEPWKSWRYSYISDYLGEGNFVTNTNSVTMTVPKDKLNNHRLRLRYFTRTNDDWLQGDYKNEATLTVKTSTGPGMYPTEKVYQYNGSGGTIQGLPYSSIQITKTLSPVGTPLEGIYFRITSQDGSFVRYAVTNADGIARLSGLVEGKYYVKEMTEVEAKTAGFTDATYPEGLIVNTERQHEVTIGNGQTPTIGNDVSWENTIGEEVIEFVNKRFPNIVIEKKERRGSTTNPLENPQVEFELWEVGGTSAAYVSRSVGGNKYSFIPVAKTGLPNAEPANYGIVPGKYILKEKAVTGYNEAADVTVTIGTDEGGKAAFTFEGEHPHVTPSTEADKENTLVYVNTPQERSVTLDAEKKVNGQTIAVDDETYHNKFTFRLYHAVQDENGKFTKGELIEERTNNGSAVTFTPDAFTYTYTEGIKDTVVWYWLEEDTTEVENLEMDTTCYVISHTMRVDDTTGAFSVEQAIHKLAGRDAQTSIANPHVDSASFNNVSKGALVISKELAGNVHEADQVFKIFVELTDANGTTLKTEDLAKYGVKAGIGEKEYTGSELKMAAEEGKTILKLGNRVPQIKGGETLQIENLRAGWKYTVSEEDCSNRGYIATITDGSGTISSRTAENSSSIVTVYNAKNGIRIKKISEGSQTALRKAVFEVRYRTSETDATDGAVIGRMQPTGADGFAYLTLPVEDVRAIDAGETIWLNLWEVAAPTGHVIASEPWIMKVSRGSEAMAGALDYVLYAPDGVTEIPLTQTKEGETGPNYYELENTPLYELPSTGGIGTYWFTIFGTLFLALAGVFVFNMADKKRRALAKARARSRNDDFSITRR